MEGASSKFGGSPKSFQLMTVEEEWGGEGMRPSSPHPFFAQQIFRTQPR